MQRLLTATLFLTLCLGAIEPRAQERSAPASSGTEAVSAHALVEAVTGLAQDLQTRVSTLETRLAQTEAVLADGEQLLRGMLDAVEAAHGALDQHGEVWRRVDGLVALWEQRRETAQARAVDDARFATLAEIWADRVAAAAALRHQISDQRARTRSLLRRLSADQAYILALIEAEQADLVLTEMQSIRDTLVEMNRTMQMLATLAADSLDVGS